MNLQDSLTEAFRLTTGLPEIEDDTAKAVIQALCEDKDNCHMSLADFCRAWASIIEGAVDLVTE